MVSWHSSYLMGSQKKFGVRSCLLNCSNLIAFYPVKEGIINDSTLLMVFYSGGPNTKHIKYYNGMANNSVFECHLKSEWQMFQYWIVLDKIATILNIPFKIRLSKTFGTQMDSEFEWSVSGPVQYSINFKIYQQRTRRKTSKGTLTMTSCN